MKIGTIVSSGECLAHRSHVAPTRTRHMMGLRSIISAIIMMAYLQIASVQVVAAQTTGSTRLTPQLVADAHTWLSSLIPQGKGPCDFVFILFTGNMVRDPDHAEAQRRLLSAWMNTTLRPGDTIRIGAGEHRLWALSDPVEITPSLEPRRAAFSALPAGPAPGSTGGKDIEAVIAEAAERIAWNDQRNAVIIMLSNSWSQPWPKRSSTGATDTLDRADTSFDVFKRVGFGPLHREVFAVPAPVTTRQVLATACVRPAASSAQLAIRDYNQVLIGWVPEAYAPMAATLPATPPSKPGPAEGRFALHQVVALAAVVLALAVIVAFGRSRRLAQSKSQPAVADHAVETRIESLPQLESAIAAAQKQADALALMRETLQDLIGKIGSSPSSSSAHDQPGVVELGQLRTELAAAEQDLADWDTTAIAYLEAAEAVVRNPAVDERNRRAWLKAANDFCRLAQRHGFGRISPEPGDPYVPGLHVAVAVEGDPARAGVVAECLRWGYQNGSRVYRLAEVRIAESHDNDKGDRDASAGGH